jgi:heme/copper-type cytochrome/quinol oxidase subunit 3
MGAQVQIKPKKPNIGLIGAAVFIVSESAFFMGVFLAYFYLRADIRLVSNRPTTSLALPLFNTLVLAVSVLAIAWAERGIAKGEQRRLVTGVAIAAALGLVFMAVQSIEFINLVQLGFTPNSSAFGSTFFALLMFHVARVFVGVSFMVIVLIRALMGQFSARRRVAVQACALYWYFIACVWLAVFVVLYIV